MALWEAGRGMLGSLDIGFLLYTCWGICTAPGLTHISGVETTFKLGKKQLLKHLVLAILQNY